MDKYYVNTNIKDENINNNNQNKDQIEGKCSNCGKIKKIELYCACKKEKYCCISCKVNAIKEHFEVCEKECIEEDNIIFDEKLSVHGICGLYNLGNSCYMNASLQCLSSCWELTKYFLSNKFSSDINVNNFMGTKGRLCRCYANILKNIWFGKKKTYMPLNFKEIFSIVKDVFSGTSEQDAHEFMSYLIDGLHEDLNKCLSKKNTNFEENEYRIKSEELKSTLKWYEYLNNNQSVLIDLFYGQFQHISCCPNNKCQNIKITYEPFFSISLPLKVKLTTKEVICYFIFFDINIKPIQLKLSFNSDCSVMALRNKISNIMNIHPFSFLIAKMNVSGSLYCLVNSRQIISIGISYGENDNRNPYFLFQFDPTIFYDKNNNRFINDINILQYKTKDFSNIIHQIQKTLINRSNILELEDDDKGSPDEIYKSYYQNDINPILENVYTDDNNGFIEDYILVFTSIYKWTESEKIKKTNLIFSRPFYLNRGISCYEIHEIIFNSFKSLLPSNTNFNDILYYFKQMLSLKTNKDMKTYQEKYKLPYLLRIERVNKEICKICDDKNCSGCILPLDDKVYLYDLLNKYPKNSENNRKTDGSYYYLTEEQRKTKNGKLKNEDFTLELIFDEKLSKSVYQALNDFSTLHIKETKKIFSNAEGINLRDCFKSFSNFEVLDDTNECLCEKCRTKQKMKIKTSISKIPHYLIIQLKRFVKNTKNEILVNYPIYGLNLSDFVKYNHYNYPLIYDLTAVSYHIGTIKSGHYTAASKNMIEDKWYLFDDLTISEIKDISQLISKNAYILIYRRRNLENIIDTESLYNTKYINYQKCWNTYEKDEEEIQKILKDN